MIYFVDLGVFEAHHHFDLNFVINSDGLTPLMLAASKRKYLIQILNFSPRMVQLVLSTRDLKVNEVDKNGFNAMHIAVQYR